MKSNIKRRQFLKSGASLSALTLAGLNNPVSSSASPGVVEGFGPKIKTSLNAYSFNRPLRDESMSLQELLEFTAECGFEAIDITGYYFKGYPDVPSKPVVNEFKRMAFLLGLDISGTGVRTDFTVPDTDKRKADIELVKNWIRLASDLGAPALRVFAGRGEPEGEQWQETAKWVADSIQQCALYGSEFGVLVALQNHAHFLKTGEQVLHLLKLIDSDWAGLMLDIGSYPTNDPYADIEQTVAHAITWQVKENVNYTDREEKTDFRRVVKIARDSNYRGYMPLETLGAGDPKVKVRRLMSEFKTALKETR